MKQLLLALTCAVPLWASAQDNLARFIWAVPHPICGINPEFDGQPKNIPPPPFASCRTLAIGYSADASYPDPGVDALAKLLIALADAGGWDSRFKPLSESLLNCRPAVPIGFPAPQGVPVCTVDFVQEYLVNYNRQPLVKDFKRLERNIRKLNLSDSLAINKIKQAVAVIQATGPSITFQDVADLLE